MPLCLCSKNNEYDALEVFRTRSEMVLRLDEHIVAHRVNWEPKSANIQALAADLKLGLDSFVFVDDSPMECCEVQTGCPTVQCVLLPRLACTAVGAASECAFWDESLTDQARMGQFLQVMYLRITICLFVSFPRDSS